MSDRTLHGFDDDTERLAHRILDYVIHRIRMSPPAARCATRTRRAGRRHRRDHHRRRPRLGACARALPRGARAGLHLERPSALPRFRPDRPGRSGDAVRSRGVRIVDLRRLVDRGRWCDPRREPGAALARRPRRSARDRRRRVRQRWHGRQPDGDDRGPGDLAGAARPRPRRRRRMRAQRPLVDPARREGHRRAGRARGSRRARPPHG